MRKIAVCLIAIGVVMGSTQASPAAPSAQCGLPDARPLWIDYAEGSVAFRNDVFGRPGVIAATSGTQNAADLRERGAQTVYWWMKLNRLAGTPSAPTDPATIPGAVSEVLAKAIASSGCETPVIVLNELNSAGSTTPWTGTNAQYRANVLDVVRRMAASGALPLLLISARPYTGGDALSWWREASAAAHLVREVYFPAPPVARAGAIIGSRTMRQRFRDGVAPLTAIGIPPERLGLVIGFQSGLGKGGREGLQPTASWLRLVKLETLAAKQVAGELKLGSVVSWGWGTFDQAGADVDKPKAACVYLWARDEGLCDGPASSGAHFNDSREEGQIALAAGAQCVLDGKPLAKTDVASLARLTRNVNVALSAVFARMVEGAGHPVASARVRAIERSIIDVRFGGSRARYEAALRSKRATVAVARDIIGDQLRREDIARKLRVLPPTAGQAAVYRTLYGTLPIRLVRADPAPEWLGGKRRGFALVPPGPDELLSLPSDVSTRVVTGEGAMTVTPLEESLPLGVVPLAVSGSAVRAALAMQARAQAYQEWTTRAQGNALNRIRCVRDVLPAAAATDLAVAYLPFLALNA